MTIEQTTQTDEFMAATLKTRARHMTESWLRSLNIPVQRDGDRLMVGSMPVAFCGELESGVVLDPIAITSRDGATVAAEIWRATEAAGYGRPSLSRGPERQSPNYRDHYEDLYLRHREYCRAPNAIPEEVQRYRPVVERAARRALARYKNLADSVGFGFDDFVSVGFVYLTSFLHGYAFNDPDHNSRVLSLYLRQRYAEWASVTIRKGKSSTYLPQDIVPISEDIDPISPNPILPDMEYETGDYIVTTDTGTMKLSVVQKGLLGVTFILDGREIKAKEARELLDLVRIGCAEIAPDVLPKPAAFSVETRRRHARIELEERLLSMDPEKRRFALGIAALSKDVDPEVRHEARRLCREKVCPVCSTPTIQSLCVCGANTVSKYGVDPIVFRREMEEAHDSLVEGFVEMDNYEKTLEKKMKEAAAAGIRKKTLVEVKDISKKMSDEYIASLPDTLKCPKCGIDKPKDAFGVRVTRDPITGDPKTCIRQSYCKKCRAVKKKVS